MNMHGRHVLLGCRITLKRPSSERQLKEYYSYSVEYVFTNIRMHHKCMCRRVGSL